MLSTTSDLLAQDLHETKARLHFWLDSLVPEPTHPLVATPEQITGLLSELLRAGQWLRAGLPQARDRELQAEIDEYRRNVERLRDLLPSIHDQLLRERARLEAERARVASAAQWAEGSRQSL